MIDDWRVPPVDDDPSCSERGIRHPVLLQEEYDEDEEIRADRRFDHSPASCWDCGLVKGWLS